MTAQDKALKENTASAPLQIVASLILYRKNFTVYSKNHILGTAKNSDFSFVYELILKFP